MPRATRNTYTSSGKVVSAPPKPNTWSKKNALTPRAAANDSTTVAVRISGATSARSKIARMTSTTPRISGNSSLLSCAEARLTSRMTAVWPPTRAWPPGTACTLERTRSMVLYAAWLSGGLVSVPCRNTCPARATGGVTWAMPGVAANAARSGPAAAGLPRAAGEVRGEHGLADDRVGVAAEGLRGRQAGSLQAGQPERQHAQDHRGGDPDQPRPGGDAPADPRPKAPGGRLG